MQVNLVMRKSKIKTRKLKILIDQLLNTLPCVMFIRYESDPEQKVFSTMPWWNRPQCV